MATLSILTELTGIALTIIGGVWLIVLAFRTHILWGLVCLIVPLLIVPFGLLHIRRAALPLGLWCAGVCLFLLNEIVFQGADFSIV